MRKTWFFLSVFLVGLFAFLLTDENDSDQDVSAVESPGVSSDGPRWPPPNLAIRDPREVVDQRHTIATNSDLTIQRDRLRDDLEYRDRIKRHTAIESFLNSPLRETVENQEFLNLLLSHGYDIDHWPHAMKVALRRIRTEQRLRDQWKSEGYSEDEIEEFWQNSDSRKSSARRFRESIRRDAQVFDEDLIEKLISIPIPLEVDGVFEIEPRIGGFDDGATILTDDDWLTTNLKLARESFTGERNTLQNVEEHLQAWTHWKLNQEMPSEVSNGVPNEP